MTDFTALGLSPADARILEGMALDGIPTDITPPDVRAALLVSEQSALTDMEGMK